MPGTVFVGSSIKSLPLAKDIETCLFRAGFKVELWSFNVFGAGDLTYDRLHERATQVDAAVFLFAEDRPLKGNRNIASENVLWEFGLFGGSLGRDRTIICRDGNPLIPSDLSGVTYIDLTEARRDAGFVKLTSWAATITPRVRSIVRSECSEAVQGLASFPMDEWRKLLSRARTVSILQTFIPYHQHLALFRFELAHALESGCRVEVLLCDPWSGACTMRQTSLVALVADVRRNVEDSLRVFAQIHQRLSAEARNRLEVRVYSTLSSVSVYRADEAMVEGIYLHDVLAIDGPQLCVTQDSYRGRHLQQEHARIWSDSATRSVPLHDLENWIKMGPFHR